MTLEINSYLLACGNRIKVLLFTPNHFKRCNDSLNIMDLLYLTSYAHCKLLFCKLSRLYPTASNYTYAAQKIYIADRYPQWLIGRPVRDTQITERLHQVWSFEPIIKFRFNFKSDSISLILAQLHWLWRLVEDVCALYSIDRQYSKIVWTITNLFKAFLYL